MSTATQKKGGQQFRPFGMLDKVAYAAGDFGCNMSFCLAGTFFTLFYTQYMKIDSLAFAGILVLLKIWDAINDPMIGGFIDASKKEYRRGKFKTFISVGSVGLLVASALCFLPFPNAPQIIKVILCLFGYICWDACYTIVNVPYGSMVNVISPEPSDRAQLSAWRNLGAMCASIPVNLVLPMVLYDENQNIMGQRLIVAALVLGIIGFVAFRFMLTNTVERVRISKEERAKQKFNYFVSIKNFAKNRPAIGATMIPVGMFLGSYGTSTAVAVMFQSYFKNAQISGVSTVLNMLPTILFVPFIGKIVDRWGKKEAGQVGLLFSIAATILMIVVPYPANGTGIFLFYLLSLCNGLGAGIATCTVYAMVADAIDYNEWKNGLREEGTTYALHSFFRKLAQGIGPSIGLVLMVAIGYDEALGAAQPIEVATKMKTLIGCIFLGAAVLQMVGLRFVYNLDRKTLMEMERDLGRSMESKNLVGKQMED